MMQTEVGLLLFFCLFLRCALAGYCTESYTCIKYITQSESYNKKCGLFGWRRCKLYRSVSTSSRGTCQRQKCCQGFTGSSCDTSATNGSRELQCYKCNPCSELFNPDVEGVEKVDCPGMCTQLIGKDVRDCNPLATEVHCDVVICTCNTDLCNNATVNDKSGGDSVTISMTTVLFPTASLIMMNLL